MPAHAGAVLLLVAVTLAGACGDRPPRVPTGEPLSVVRTSADLTERSGEMRVFVDAPGESVNAVVDLARGAGPVEIRERAGAALAAIRTAEQAEAFGGQQVRGISTMRYDVTPRGGGDIDVWVSVDGRARRVQLPDGPLTEPPPTQANGLPGLVTIDFVFSPQPVVREGPPDL